MTDLVVAHPLDLGRQAVKEEPPIGIKAQRPHARHLLHFVHQPLLLLLPRPELDRHLEQVRAVHAPERHARQIDWHRKRPRRPRGECQGRGAARRRLRLPHAQPRPGHDEAHRESGRLRAVVRDGDLAVERGVGHQIVPPCRRGLLVLVQISASSRAGRADAALLDDRGQVGPPRGDVEGIGGHKADGAVDAPAVVPPRVRHARVLCI